MKHHIIAVMFALVIPSAALAETIPTKKPGFAPGDFGYFFDRLGERVHMWFTFGPESEARLALQYAQERAAEIDKLIGEKGAGDEGVARARDDFDKELARASLAVLSISNRTPEVATLAKDIDDASEQAKETLLGVYEKHKKDIDNEKEVLAKKLEQGGDDADHARLNRFIEDAGRLSEEADSVRHDFDEEKDRLEVVMGEEVSATRAIENAGRTKDRFVLHMKDKGLSQDGEIVAALKDFDALMTKARAALASKDFATAKEDIRDAISVLDDVRGSVEFDAEMEDMMNEMETGGSDEDSGDDMMSDHTQSKAGGAPVRR